MDKKLQLKQMRSRMNPAGLTMLAYYGIMNVAVMVVMLLDLIVYLFSNLDSWSVDGMLLRLTEFVTANGWGYLLAMAVGGLIVWLWKGTVFWKQEVFAKEKPMTVGAFVQLLCVFISVQTVLQLLVPLIEYLYNLLGLSATAALESASISTTGVSMFLYVAILGPVAEELLCRGLVLRMLRPFGKQMAIFGAALLFGLFHGNVIQIPFAFLIGLVLGYVTLEHSIWWAIVLHIFNNLVLSELMGRLSQVLPEGVGDLLLFGILFLALIAAIVILIVRRKAVKAYLQENRLEALPVKAFFTAPGVLIFGVLMLLSSLLTLTIL